MARVFRLVCVLTLLGVTGSSRPAAAQIVGGHIAGVVVDELGQPLAEVFVTAHGPEQSQLMKTDAKGQFRLHDLIPGRYVLTVARDGFTTIVHSGMMVHGGRIAQMSLVLKISPDWAKPIAETPDPFALLPPASRISSDLVARNTP